MEDALNQSASKPRDGASHLRLQKLSTSSDAATAAITEIPRYTGRMWRTPILMLADIPTRRMAAEKARGRRIRVQPVRSAGIATHEASRIVTAIGVLSASITGK